MKKILEKAKQNPLLIAAVILMIVTLVVGYQYGVKKEATRTAKIFEEKAKEVKKESEKAIAEIFKTNKELIKNNREKDKVIAEHKANEKRLIKEREEKAKELKERKEKIQIAPPESLVEISRQILNIDEKGISRQILNTDEIYWNEEKQVVEFSLLAFKVLTTKLVDWEDFTLYRESNYLEQLQDKAVAMTGLEEKIVNLNIVIGNLLFALDERDNSYNAISDAFAEYKRSAGKKSLGVLEKIFWGLIGYGAGALFGN